MILLVTGGSKSIDNTKVGGTLSGDRLHQVFGHLFDGVRTVHVEYVPSGGPAVGSADAVIGPPVQAKITLSNPSAPGQAGTVIITGDKAYLHAASLGSKWILTSSADDGISSAPAFGQTNFELLYLGPHTVGTYKGSATIAGISTREYVLTASTSTATPSATSASQTIATVWIDNTGRLIQYTYSPTGDGSWVTATYSKWGEPVTVQAPPAKDVTVLSGTM
ncbi:hypothetical protein Back2_01050 [Nocardioides baekrokdamisoli]|uniref:Uncharacterized protein n=1 Tax=Nocardioides baekrokdamisoli TaxID=1804624 RepID=A0A3G9IX23_9ACTN|nr:hypothetical protein Back2_01050 [Nocardioides baekrokdamisoli]